MFNITQPLTANSTSHSWPSSLNTAQTGQQTKKRTAPYADSDQEEEEDGLIALGIKKVRTQPSIGSINAQPFPSQPTFAANAFISPPVTPTPIPLHRRQTSDIPMEDTDMAMADSQPSSQRDWNSTAITLNTNIPAFVQQDSNLSAISMADADAEDDEDDRNRIGRPHTPGMIMKDMNRLEVSPSSETQNRLWSGMESTMAKQTQQQPHAAPPPKGRFTMGYRADCEKCRNRVPGHYAHPPGF
ncbi:hypothetical protein ABW19_dt0203410 [Dactylella cylindrospora]|nr:hypothetical protein ABW19_dt0203410 [Dactylella cylindrospora]